MRSTRRVSFLRPTRGDLLTFPRRNPTPAGANGTRRADRNAANVERRVPHARRKGSRSLTAGQPLGQSVGCAATPGRGRPCRFRRRSWRRRRRNRGGLSHGGCDCRRYGRLYTWESAQRGCQSLRDGWRLPTDDEWRQMATHYGGLGNDSPAKGKAAYTALLSGGASGFNAVLGGNRSIDGHYDRLEAHGIYWKVSENDPITAPFYNFGKATPTIGASRR